MPRKMRVEYPGAIYHVMSRGDRCEAIFLDDVDRQDYLKTLAESCQKTGWQVHAYCLMRNHFHLVLATPNANLVEGMRWNGRLQIPLHKHRGCRYCVGVAEMRHEPSFTALQYYPKHYCGVFGVYGHPNAAELTYYGLYALQHRGQESAGIVTSDGKQFHTHKGMGLVSQVFK